MSDRKRAFVRISKHPVPRYTARTPTAEAVWGTAVAAATATAAVTAATAATATTAPFGCLLGAFCVSPGCSLAAN